MSCAQFQVLCALHIELENSENKDSVELWEVLNIQDHPRSLVNRDVDVSCGSAACAHDRTTTTALRGFLWSLN